MQVSINCFFTAAHVINSLLRRHVVHMVQQFSHAPEPQASQEEEACCQSQGEPAPIWNLHTDQISVRGLQHAPGKASFPCSVNSTDLFRIETDLV